MSLRRIARELGISPAYLSYMVNGKRPWRADLYERYRLFVNTFVNTQGQRVNNVIGHLAGNDGAGDRIRTGDTLLGRQALYR